MINTSTGHIPILLLVVSLFLLFISQVPILLVGYIAIFIGSNFDSCWLQSYLCVW